MSDSELAGFAMGLAVSRMYEDGSPVQSTDQPESHHVTDSDLMVVLRAVFLAISETMTDEARVKAERLLLQCADHTTPKRAWLLRAIIGVFTSQHGVDDAA